MSKYPMARWSLSETRVGASVWTRKLGAGQGGGYYLYEWQRGASALVLRELVEGTTREERQFPVNKRSVYVDLAVIHVSEGIGNGGAESQESGVARLIHTDITERFGPIAEWITYDNSGRPVWFHGMATEGNGK